MNSSNDKGPREQMTKKRVFVSGHLGMAGSAIYTMLQKDQDIDLIVRSRKQLDLTDQSEVRNFFASGNIDEVYIAAAKVGGIMANENHPAEFSYENLMIESNLIHESWKSGVKKLLLLGSSCVYPKFATQPMSENQLLTGRLESTSEPYAIAKIAGINLCQSYNRQYSKSHGIKFKSIILSNLYGPGDSFDTQNSHVIPGLIQKIHKAKQEKNKSVTLWGTGSPLREFLYVDDLASASVFVMNIGDALFDKTMNFEYSHINVGSGKEMKIKEVAEAVKKMIGFEGKIIFDSNKPDGAPRKLMNISKITSLGWQPQMEFEIGLKNAYEYFLSSKKHL